ncbi:MAG: DUF2764 family protein [Candidatus Omnitrophica bacterium]|nr:DUF2764 family protein [Candidatus Omnitrophota bacterium]
MPDLYVYFIASLPMLRFSQSPPFSAQELLSRCSQLIPEEDVQVLRSLLTCPEAFADRPVIRAWLDFDTALRNELVRIRAGRKKAAAQKYLRPDGYAGPAIYHIALAAHRNPSPLEGERLLDEARWNYLEELSFGHYFDLDFLIVYMFKLLILERWQRIHSADKETLLKEVLYAG